MARIGWTRCGRYSPALRDAYGLKEGAELEVTDSGGEISLKPVLDSRRDAPSRRSLTSEEVLSVRSFPKYQGPVVTDEMMHEAISRAAIEDSGAVGAAGMARQTIDTSILVRLFAQDDDVQFATRWLLASRAVVPDGASGNGMGLKKPLWFRSVQIHTLFNAVLDARNVFCRERQVIVLALDAYVRGMDFADALHVCLTEHGRLYHVRPQACAVGEAVSRGRPRRAGSLNNVSINGPKIMNAHLQPTGSAYFIAKETEVDEKHTLSVLVDNEPGVLARVIGLFSGRGYNIESLTVSETEHEAHLSRITVVTRGTPHVLEQIKAQLERLVPVHRVVDLTVRANTLGHERPIEREVALVKVKGTGDNRAEMLRLADAFHAKVVDATVEHFIFEITGKSSKIDQFVAIMKPLGLIEVCRTGIAAMNRGAQGM